MNKHYYKNLLRTDYHLVSIVNIKKKVKSCSRTNITVGVGSCKKRKRFGQPVTTPNINNIKLSQVKNQTKNFELKKVKILTQSQDKNLSMMKNKLGQCSNVAWDQIFQKSPQRFRSSMLQTILTTNHALNDTKIWRCSLIIRKISWFIVDFMFG